MALPNLPPQGQNPWYTTRNAWDLSVKAELEGRLSEAGITSAVATALADSIIIRYAAGMPNRPNIILGGLQNGSDILPGTIHSFLGQPGGPGFNNIIGGDGTLTVTTSTPNVLDYTIANVGVSNILGYDNVVGSISGKINSDHSYTAKGSAGHNAIFGGQGHVIGAAGGFSMVAGGNVNKINGAYTLVTGNTNTVDGTGSFVAGLFNTMGVGTGSTIVGQSNDVQTSYARVTGFGNKVESLALFADVSGAYGKARSPFLRVHAAGRISVDGDAQTVSAQYRGQSTSATAVLLIAAYTGTGSGSQYLMVQGQTASISVEVTARTVGGATVGVWNIRGVAAWATGGAGPVWLSGSPVVTPVYTDGSSAAPTLLLGAGGSAGRVFIQCTGLAATTINWSANLKSLEVMA